MAEKVRFYLSKEQRQSIINDERRLGFFILHDDFVDSNGKITDGTSGRITFDDTETKEPANRTTTLDVALMELLSERGVESDAELAKLKNILDRESLAAQRNSSIQNQYSFATRFKNWITRKK